MIGASLAMFLVAGTGPFVLADGTGRTTRLAPIRRTRDGRRRSWATRGRGLPVLRAALEAKDPEVRARAAVLVEKTEAPLLTQPTMI